MRSEWLPIDVLVWYFIDVLHDIFFRIYIVQLITITYIRVIIIIYIISFLYIILYITEITLHQTSDN